MGNYLNSGTEGFQQMLRSPIYVDKTGLIKYTNMAIGTEGKCIALSHARRFDMDFDSVKEWYNGYLISGEHMYNPNSVYSAMTRHKVRSYWKNTSSFETLNKYITLNMEGLKDAILHMLSGGRADVRTDTFKNDLSDIGTGNEAMTALIHLGYLAYDSDTEEAFVPNYEVDTAYRAALADSGWIAVAKSIDTCQRALNAIILNPGNEGF